MFSDYPDATTKPDHCMFRYHWDEVLEADPATAINVMLLLGTFVTWTLGIIILLEYDRLPREEKNEAAINSGARRVATSPINATSSWQATDHAPHAL